MKRRIKILVSPNAFKECLSAFEVAEAIAKGIKQGWKQAKVIQLPVADGGNGTLDVLVSGTNGKIISFHVKGPLGNPVKARLGILDDGKTAIVEMAEASGLHLVPFSKRNPINTTTYGTGELIRHALDLGAKKIIVGVGGSATVDCGIGMAMALGGKFLDKEGKSIGLGAKGLNKLFQIDLSTMDKRLRKVQMVVACDVRNPLIGPKGTVAMYSRQKGATPKMMPVLESGIRNVARIVKNQPGLNISNISGSGAAGGLGAGLYAFCGARIQLGIEIVLNTLEFDKYLKEADIVITGEGKLDMQTLYGKAPIGVARLAKKYHLPVIAIAGSIDESAKILHRHGIDAIFGIQMKPMTQEESMKNAKSLIEFTSRQISTFLKSIDNSKTKI